VHEVYLEKIAENDFKRLPTTTFHRIIPKIRDLDESPRPSGCRKLADSKNDCNLNIESIASKTGMKNLLDI
jgi:mRNA interferase RelE/StbE